MKTYQALATIMAAGDNLDEEEFEKAWPVLAKRAKRSLRSVGSTTAEIEAEFPDAELYRGLNLIKDDPDEFKRQALVAMANIIQNN